MPEGREAQQLSIRCAVGTVEHLHARTRAACSNSLSARAPSPLPMPASLPSPLQVTIDDERGVVWRTLEQGALQTAQAMPHREALGIRIGSIFAAGIQRVEAHPNANHRMVQVRQST